MKNTEIEQISNTLKGTKIEQGISYLPTALEDLRQMLGKLWEEGIENKILPVLKEMVRRGGVTIEQFLTLLKGELRSENYHPSKSLYFLQKRVSFHRSTLFHVSVRISPYLETSM
ncbi:MAG: hypothetical protein CMB97_01650 [Flavobacteriaceae bacterium]|nr:hypothetical protein [Flavobacteriaceae bacterium]